MIETLQKYRMSFSTGGLFHKESVLVAECFCRLKDWEKTRKQILDENILMARTNASLKRNTQEIILRLKNISESVVKVIPDCCPDMQRKIIWYAVCETYDFIKDFAREVIVNKHQTMQYQIDYSDFEEFFNSKTLWHTELERLKPKTIDKLRQVLFKILREAEIITDKGFIIPFNGIIEIPMALRHNKSFAQIMPMSNAELKRWLEK